MTSSALPRSGGQCAWGSRSTTRSHREHGASCPCYRPNREPCFPDRQKRSLIDRVGNFRGICLESLEFSVLAPGRIRPKRAKFPVDFPAQGNSAAPGPWKERARADSSFPTGTAAEERRRPAERPRNSLPDRLPCGTRPVRQTDLVAELLQSAREPAPPPRGSRPARPGRGPGRRPAARRAARTSTARQRWKAS